MAISITNSEIIPALIYDKFFMENLELVQKIDKDNSKQPYYTLKITYRLYAVDVDNNRHFKPKTSTININDYLLIAIDKASQGDMDLIQAAGAIEQALATIISDQTNLGLAEVIN